MATADQILDAAEIHIRRQGFNSFSFRTVAADIGIKSASVHYHFPTKAALGAAVAARYSSRMAEALGDAMDASLSPDDLIARYIGAYRHALLTNKSMCVCGLLAAEIGSLPEEVQQGVKAFMDLNLAWLAALAGRIHPGMDKAALEGRASRFFTAMQGAILWARAQDNAAILEDAGAAATAAFLAP